MKLPIVSGPLRGKWWLPAAKGKVLRVLGGSYEREQSALFGHWVGAGQTVLDVGAHVGYYALLASTLVGEGGEVHAFEPDPRNARFLRQHMRINRRENVTIVELAVTDSGGVGAFRAGRGSGTGRLAPDGEAEVRTVRLDDYCDECGLAPDTLKVDVEGAELEVLAGAERVLDHRPVIFLSTHSSKLRAGCEGLLRGRGYRFQPIAEAPDDSWAELLCIAAE